MNKCYKKFTTKQDMLEALLSLSPTFNKEATLELNNKNSTTRFHLVFDNGNEQVYKSFKRFVAAVAYYSKTTLLHRRCFFRSSTYHVFSKKPLFEGQIIQQENPTSFIEECKALLIEGDTKKSKELLHDKALSEKGIKLKKTLTLPNMLAELEESLAKEK